MPPTVEELRLGLRGVRIRSLSISIEKVLGRESARPRTSSLPEAIAEATVGAHHDPV
jgi:hypothetical protein